MFGKSEKQYIAILVDDVDKEQACQDIEEVGAADAEVDSERHAVYFSADPSAYAAIEMLSIVLRIEETTEGLEESDDKRGQYLGLKRAKA